MAKARITVAKDPKGGYNVNRGGRKVSHHTKKSVANKKAASLKAKRK